MTKRPTKKNSKSIETLTHDEAKRINIPTAEYQSIVEKDLDQVSVTYKRDGEALKEEKEMRDRDQDPQLVWRGKDQQDWSDLAVNARPLYIQEKVHPKILIDDLRNRSIKDEKDKEPQVDLFADFNGLPDEGAKTEFYQHDAYWSNRMILGDSLQVMASLADREGLRGKVQCIYLDPPYGVKFSSNFQWSTTNRDVKDITENMSREPETVKAFRDTWRDGIHSYLTYLRDRLIVARDLLSDSGSIFVQIGDQNLHLVTSLLADIFGLENQVSVITFRKTNKALGASLLGGVTDHIVWFAKNKKAVKYRPLKILKDIKLNPSSFKWCEDNGVRRKSTQEDIEKFKRVNDVKFFTPVPLTSSGYTPSCIFDFNYKGRSFSSGSRKSWATTKDGVEALIRADRIHVMGNTPFWIQYFDDLPTINLDNIWDDTRGELSKTYVVQTATKVVQRCILMTTDPGDLVMDPTCGSGTTAYVAEYWGRRWVTMDTSRVALTLARSRIMGSIYPYFLLRDSREGCESESPPLINPVKKAFNGSINQGFVYERAPRVTLKSIANNSEIGVVWESFHARLVNLFSNLKEEVGVDWSEWEVPLEPNADWSAEAKQLHAEWLVARKKRQKEINSAVYSKSEYELLFDKPRQASDKVRVSGPFTVESLSPHRYLGVDENDDLIDGVMDSAGSYGEAQPFVQMILENLKTAGVQQMHKEDKINFASLVPWPGQMICAEGQYSEGEGEGDDFKRTAIFVGPEFGTVSRPDLVVAAREAADAGFDVLVACAFNYDAHSTEFNTLGSLPVLKARMNPELHMAEDLKNTGKGNLFVIFGEPDIDLLDAEDGKIQIKINGVDVFHPNAGEIRSDGADGIACWFVDTDYNEESFFVRQAYFLGAKDPYKSLKTTLKAEINEDAWATLNSDTSRPFAKPSSGRIAVKVINHLGDEVMKVYKVD